MIKIEIKTLWETILFTHKSKNNTIKETVEKAVKDGAYLSGADLRGAYLRGAYLSGAYLRGADLRGADLSGADLSGAYLRSADLRGAYLSGAYLRGADLSGAYLRGTYLRGADLRSADLRGAYLRGAYLRSADLRGADLSGADLRGADLSGAYLRGAKNIPFIPFACPSDGAFFGWKKVKNCLVKLEIPEDAKRCSATTSKCRCDKAKVLDIFHLERQKSVDSVTNDNYNPSVTYKVGEMVYPDSFDEDRWNECSNGIHFFINKQEAIDY